MVGFGGRFTGSNPSYTATELGHHFRNSQTRLVITAKAQLEVVKNAAAANKISFDRIILVDGDDDDDEFTSLQTVLQRGQQHWRTFSSSTSSMSTTAALMSTSGTTGLPKMAARSHYSWIAENQAIEDRVEKPYNVSQYLPIH